MASIDLKINLYEFKMRSCKFNFIKKSMGIATNFSDFGSRGEGGVSNCV